MIKFQTDPFTLQTGNPKGSTTENIKDPNYTKTDGHLDEINPSTSKDFNALPYNIRFRDDPVYPAYSAKDKFPETPSTCNRGDTSDAVEITLPAGEYKYKPDQKSKVVDCVKYPQINQKH